MPRCPITLEEIPADDRYSRTGLRLLDRNLKELNPLDLTSAEQLQEAAAHADKMSIQGVQPKLSAVLRVKEGRWEIVDRGGRYILKPCPAQWPEVPANEALTMTLAQRAGIEVPPHGLIYAADNTLTYFIRRFDRIGHGDKVPVEDFAQLTNRTRETKYDSSLEMVVAVIDSFCTFPAVEKRKLARRVLFSFLTGNEDMHLKNYSLSTRGDKVELTPAYDLLNTTIVLGKNTREESALPIRGKKSKLTRNDLAQYFCHERLGLPDRVIEKLVNELLAEAKSWPELIKKSFLSAEKQEAYRAVVEERAARMQA